MIIAAWIIAVCEVLRMLQNFVQISNIKKDSSARDNVYAEFIKSLKIKDREFVRRFLEEFEKENNHDEV